MVKVNGDHSRINKLPPNENWKKAESDKTNAEFRKFFDPNENDIETFNSKALKAEELQTEVFSKKDRDDAQAHARTVLSKVQADVGYYNADFPDKPFFIDYESFPRPENYPPKRHGGKEKAYVAWREAVTTWQRDIDTRLTTLRSTNLADIGATLDMYAEEINAKLDRNLFAFEIEQGVTRQFIVNKYVELKGDINKVTVAVRKEAARIREEVEDVGNGLSMQMDDHSRYLHEHIDNSERNIKNTVTDAKIEVADVVTAESDRTNKNIDKKSKETQEINALSDAISNAINGIKITGTVGAAPSVHTERTVQKVENLKQQIISSNRIDHSTKVRLLTDLKNLVIRDNWITSNDLDRITERISRIAL